MSFEFDQTSSTSSALNKISCPGCGRRVDDRVPACPGCGEKIYVEHPGDVTPTKHWQLDANRPNTNKPDATNSGESANGQ